MESGKIYGRSPATAAAPRRDEFPTMKILGYLLLALSFAQAEAQERPDDPKAGELLDCGAEKVAIFADTTSKDGHFALGWTLRPNRKKEPVDWSIYKPDDRGSFYEKHSFVGDNDYDMEIQDYLVVDGILDLKDKVFTPMPSNNPYFPGKNHWGIAVSWSEDQHGVRYAVVGNQARFYTHNLWLVILRSDGSQVVNLSPQADKAVEGYMHKRDPKDYTRYGVNYEVGETARDGEPSGTVFTKQTLTIRFSAEIPKSETDYDVGLLTFSIPKGKVLHITPAKKPAPAGNG